MSYKEFPVQLDVNIRHAITDDMADLEWFGLYEDARSINEENLMRAQAGEVVFLVAELNRFAIGQILIDLTKHQAENIAIIWAFRLMPSMQNLGIGTQLLHAAEEDIRRREYKTAQISVGLHNQKARRLYERMGYHIIRKDVEIWSYFTPEGEQHHVTEHVYVMQKFLQDHE